jgi:RNA polymerase sigma factor (sigma-70 family)
MNYSQEAIIEGCKRKDKTFQRALYDTYSPKLFAICLRYAKGKADAEDIFQEAFIKLFYSLDKYEYKGSFEGWLRKFFINFAINYYNKKENKRITKVDITEDFGIKDENGEVEMNFNFYEKEEIIKAIESLNDKERMIVNLVEIEGYSYEEVEQELNMNNSTIRSLNYRAKKHLKEYFDKKQEKERKILI